jgi:hypothetical protein
MDKAYIVDGSNISMLAGRKDHSEIIGENCKGL